MSDRISVLFVCLGNICRSPLAEVVVRDRATMRGLGNLFTFASAGTGSWHIGKGADQRSAETARKYGLDLSHHAARQITAGTVDHWQWFVAMDHDNRTDLISMGVPEDRLLLMRQFEPGLENAPDVPDPYYGGDDGFEDAYRMLCENADRLLDYLEERAL
ncbi:MAG: low molecular weight phosphotyrosine protein phosphatase [Mariprofundaceae bacterium]|nr:low molecular weight phosphotyrosine protein phosphatase [Mariprofundaceae bacterium]